MTLTPQNAVLLADAAYQIKGASTEATTDDVLNWIFDANPDAATEIEDKWTLGATPTLAFGRSGAGLIKSRTGIAMVMHGKRGSGFEGETTVSIRGTAGFYDVLSDLHATVSTSPVGLPVHTGFASIYNDIHLDLKKAVGDRGRIHIMGHSLGGALANLLAADLARGGQHKVNLYTFGSPRVGLESFGSAMASRPGLEAIYRVYDVVDPVPMVPVFPFMHAPFAGKDYRVGASGGLMRPDAHRLTANYLEKVRGKSWEQIAQPQEPIYNYRKIDELIEAAGIHVSIPGGTWGLKALGEVLLPLMEIAALVVGGVRYLGETVIDMISRMLIRAAEVSRKIGSYVMRFIELVMKWAGRKAVDGVEMTSLFLSYLLRLLVTPVLIAARKAIDLSPI